MVLMGGPRGPIQFKMALKRLKNRDTFLRIDAWKNRMTDELWAQELYDTQFILETNAREEKLHAGVRQIKICMRRVRPPSSPGLARSSSP